MGSLATQYMLKPARHPPPMPDGWGCQQPPLPMAQAARLPPPDFNSNPSHRIDAYLRSGRAAFGDEGFQNCAQVRDRGSGVGSGKLCRGSKSRLSETILMSRTVQETRHADKTLVCFDSGSSPPINATLTVRATNGGTLHRSCWLSEVPVPLQNPGAGRS